MWASFIHSSGTMPVEVTKYVSVFCMALDISNQNGVPVCSHVLLIQTAFSWSIFFFSWVFQCWESIIPTYCVYYRTRTDTTARCHNLRVVDQWALPISLKPTSDPLADDQSLVLDYLKSSVPQQVQVYIPLSLFSNSSPVQAWKKHDWQLQILTVTGASKQAWIITCLLYICLQTFWTLQSQRQS